MRNIYIRHKVDTSVVLVCDDNFNPVKEASAAHQKLEDKACYVSFAGCFFGVYSSVDGPVMFVNDEKYLFADKCWAVLVRPGKQMNTVVFSGLKSGIFSFDYPPVKLDPLDPWLEEEFDDFFIWLSKQRSNGEFVRMWTLKT